MQSIEKKNLENQKSDQLEKIHCTDYGGQISDSKRENSVSKSLSRSIVERLIQLADKSVETDINPKTINAACNCFSQAYKFMQLNLKYRKDI